MSWFEAKRDGNCSQCGVPVTAGTQMWAVRKGYYTCESCGVMREEAVNHSDQGAVESGVMESLKIFPPEAMGTAPAQTMIYMARLMDRMEVNPRDVPAVSKEIRQALAQLEIMFPPVPEDDATAAAQKRRERKMAGLDDFNE